MESVNDFMTGLGVAWDAAMTPAGLGVIAAAVIVLGAVVWFMKRGDR